MSEEMFDKTPVGPMPWEIAEGEKDPISIQLAKDMRKKYHGKDTRETMARMIEWTGVINNSLTGSHETLDQQFTDVMLELSKNQDYHSLPEIAAARGGRLTLGQRLTESDAKLNQVQALADSKMDKNTTDISVSQINKNLGKFDQTYMSEEFLQQMAGNAPINMVPADGSLTTDKYADGSVTQAKVSFVDSSGYADTIIKASVSGAIAGISKIISNNTARTAVFEIEPDKEYTISKEPSSRFRVATTVAFPKNGSEFNNFYLDEFNQANEQVNTRFSFVSKPGDNYLVVYYSNAGESVQVHLAEGHVPEHDFKKVKLLGDINAPNIVRGKNLFDGVYHEGAVTGLVSSPNDAYFKVRGRGHARSIIQPIERNTNYSIYKTVTNRFRVALTNKFPSEMSSLYMIQDETRGSDKKSSFSFNSGEYDYLVVTVSNKEDNIEIPDFVQIEKGDKVTELETYGYKFYPEAKSLVNAENDDVVRVESFRFPDMTDSEVLQKAFDNANGQIISLESGRTYSLDSTVSALASKVRGITGNNATLEINGTNQVALKITGSRSTGSASPTTVSDDLIRSEGNFTIDGLIVTSNSKFKNDAIEIQGLFKPVIKNSLIFRCRNGLIFKGVSRDVTLDNNNIYDNAKTGLLFDNVNIHQLLIRGGHNSYNKNCVKFIDGDVANVVFDSASIENHITGGGYDVPESIVSFEESSEGAAIFEVIIFSGCNIQEHGQNTKPMVNFDVSNGQIYDVIIGDTLLGNCGPSSVPFYGKNIRTLSINNVNTPSNVGANSFVLEGEMSQVRITGSNIRKPLNYDNATIDKMIIANNTTVGFTLPDSNDGNILIKDNI